MTDHDADHDRDPQLDADRAWFRAQVAPVVEAQPVHDRWPTVAARLDGLPVRATPERGRRTARALLAAAAAVLVVAATLAVVATRHDTSHVQVGGPGAEASGFVVPTDLPAGWEVMSVTIGRRPPTATNPCPCVRSLWVDGHGGHLSLTVEDEDPDVDLSGTGRSIDLGDGVSGVVPDGQGGALYWVADGRVRRLFVAGTDEAGLVRAGRDLVARPGAAPEGWTLRSRAEGDPQAAPPTITMQVRTDADGTSLAVQLSAPWTTPRAFNIEYPTMELLDLPDGPALRTPDEWGGEGYVEGFSDTVHMHVGWGDLPYQGHPNGTRASGLDAYETMVRHLRPATADQWRRFLDGVDGHVSPELRTAASLDAVFEPQPAGTNSPTTAAPKPTSPIDTTTSTEPTPGGMLISDPGTSEPRALEGSGTSFTDLDGIEIRLELAAGVVRAGQPTAGTLVFRNTTDHAVELTECTRLLTSWALLPTDQPDGALPQRRIIDCYATGTPDLDVGETVRMPLRFGEVDGFDARTPNSGPSATAPYLGTLAAGRYLAVAEVPGRDSVVRVQLPVQVPGPACPMSDELAARWQGRTLAAVTTAAEAEGYHVVVVLDEQGEHPTGWDLDCQRLRAVVSADHVLDYTLG